MISQNQRRNRGAEKLLANVIYSSARMQHVTDIDINVFNTDKLIQHKSTS